MKVDGTQGIRLLRIETTRKKSDRETQTVTYQYEDPGFEDCFQMSDIRKCITHPGNPIPLNFMMDGVGRDGVPAQRLGNQITSAFTRYHSGVTDEKAVEDALADVVANFRSAYIDMGCDPAEFMPQLLNDVYNRAKISNVNGAAISSFQDSRALAAQYNGSNKYSSDVIYYDSKYYYQTEAMKVTLRESILRIGERYGVKNLELSGPEPNDPVARKIYSSYNTVINDNARQNLLVGNMVDESMVPPKDFRFFYKSNDDGMNIYSSQLTAGKGSESFFDGVLHVWYGDWSYTGLVPVRMDATKYPVSVNMYDTIARSGKEIPDEIVPALKNFDFFTMIQSGNYFKNHPRKLPY